MKKYISSLFAALMFFISKAEAQIPKEVPHPDNNKPLDLSSPADIIIYIVIPVVFIILFFVWRSRRKKKNK
ncbi:adenylosuccinate synthetase [uncultured Marixanthomonas sp.]|uniref:adenylosuccinate synthetase n=1 Tax=uncultured Marixanthomonas sp. TaxID=757245 RepID=UPI0030DB4913|tara:strand:- start:69248 stop:69460 length:213 start_codon:yes stop_codon:yes gene_type:complete